MQDFIVSPLEGHLKDFGEGLIAGPINTTTSLMVSSGDCGAPYEIASQGITTKTDTFMPVTTTTERAT